MEPGTATSDQIMITHPEGGQVGLTTDQFGALWTYLSENQEAIENGPSDLGVAFQRLQSVVPQGTTQQ